MNDDDELEQEAAENKYKNIKNKGKSKLLGAIKQFFVILMRKWGKKVILIITIFIVFDLLVYQTEKEIFKGITDLIKSVLTPSETTLTGHRSEFLGGENNSMDFASSELVKIEQKDGEYCIEIDEKLVNEIEKKLEEDNIKPEDLNLKDFSCFREFIKAEIVTQFPKLGNVTEAEALSGNIITDGVIKIQRLPPEKNATPKDLKYRPKDEFLQMCEKNDEGSLNYFTLNENRELIIASYEKSETTVESSGDETLGETPNTEDTYNITTTTINYLSVVEKYTMPFSLLLSILQTSDSEKMALDFAQLAQESEMIITIADNTEITTYNEEKVIKQSISGEKKLDYSIIRVDTPNPEDNTDEDEETTTDKGEGTTTTVTTPQIPITELIESETAKPIEYDKQEKERTIKTKTVITTNTPKIELTKVDCWLAKIERTYTYKEETAKTGPDKTESEPEEEQVQCDINTDEDVTNFLNERKQTLQESMEEKEGYTSQLQENRINLDTTSLKRKTQTTTTIETETVTKSYTSTKSEVDSNEEKVFKIFRNNRKAYGRLKDAQKWFYELLETEPQTEKFVDTFKYLINKFNNNAYKGELDLDQYDLEDFESSSENGGGVFGCNMTQQEFKTAASKYKKGDTDYQKYMVENIDKFYKICKEYNVNPCLAFAHACLETDYGSSEGCKEYKNYFGFGHGNEDSSGKKYTTVEDSIKDYCEWVKKRTTPGTPEYISVQTVSKKYAKYNKAFTGDPANNMYDLYSTYAYLGDTHVTDDNDYTVEWGKGGRTYTRIIYGGYDYSSKTWKDKSKYQKECGNKHKKASSKTTTKEQADYAEYAMNQRVSIAKTIFGEDALATSSGGSILEKAAEIHTYMEQNGYKYCLLGSEKEEHSGSCGLDTTFEESKKGHKLTCCATYISWVLNEAGYDKCKGKHNCTDLAAAIKNNYKYKQITKRADLKPGDICFKGGAHVQMYGEDGKWYNAGSNNAISKAPYAWTWNEWTFALRITE